MNDAPLSHALAPKDGKYLDPQVELDLLAKYKDTGCTASLNRLLLNYSDLCMRFANRYRNRFEIADTYQDAMEFLIQVAKRFDPVHGVPFFTYAHIHVGHLMSMRAIRNWASVTTPASKAFFKAFRAMPRNNHGELSYAGCMGLAEALGVTLEDIYAAQAIYKDSALSLNSSLFDDGEDMLDCLHDHCDPADIVIEADFNQKREKDAARRMSTLTPREERIMKARHLTEVPLKLHDLAAEFGVSIERVRQLEVKAIAKLRMAA